MSIGQLLTLQVEHNVSWTPWEHVDYNTYFISTCTKTFLKFFLKNWLPSLVLVQVDYFGAGGVNTDLLHAPCFGELQLELEGAGPAGLDHDLLLVHMNCFCFCFCFLMGDW